MKKQNQRLSTFKMDSQKTKIRFYRLIGKKEAKLEDLINEKKITYQVYALPETSHRHDIPYCRRQATKHSLSLADFRFLNVEIRRFSIGKYQPDGGLWLGSSLLSVVLVRSRFSHPMKHKNCPTTHCSNRISEQKIFVEAIVAWYKLLILHFLKQYSKKIP